VKTFESYRLTDRETGVYTVSRKHETKMFSVISSMRLARFW